MKRLPGLITYFLASFLVACGAVIDPASLKRAAPGASLEMPNGYVYISPPAGIHDNQFKYELAAGTYIAELENDIGAYFRGPTECVSTSVAASNNKEQPINKITKAEGGVFVPRNPREIAKIYFYRGVQTDSSLPMQTSTDIAQRAAPKASIGQSAAGGAIGGAVISALIASEQGKIGYMPGAKDNSLRAALVFGKK